MYLKTREVLMVLSSLATIISGFSSQDRCFCPTTFDPVCASNGHVFTNACALECYNIENQEDLKVIVTGHCVEHLNASTIVLDQQLDRCYRQCKNDYNPIVNAPDRKIYWNDCYYQCNSKKEKRKSRIYMLLLGILSAIECTVVFLTKYIRRQKQFSVFE